MSFKFHIVAAIAVGGLAGGASLAPAGPAVAQTLGLTASPAATASSTPVKDALLGADRTASEAAAAPAETSAEVASVETAPEAAPQAGTGAAAPVEAVPPAPAPAPETVAAVPSPQTPLAAAILRAAASDGELKAWYAARDGRPAWTVSGGELDAQALLARLDEAESHALPAAAYSPAALRQRAQGALASSGAPEDMAALELDLSRALVRYAGDMSAGALVPSRIDSDIHVFPDRPKAMALMTQAETAPDLGAWLDGLAPTDPGYAPLRALYARLQTEAASGGWRATLSEGGTLRPGQTGERVTQLRARLAELGEPTPASASPELYDAGLETAVKAFQRRHGLNDDGIAGARTFAALGADVGSRIRQVAVNLERMRWAPHDLGRKYIVVNQPDYRLRLYEDGKLIHQTRVVVGQRQHQTPEFIDDMDHLVVNPSWNVPRSIATNEILPALRKDPYYLEKQNMRLISTDGGPVPADPSFVDWTQYSKGHFPYRVKQAPGDGNALGKVKFMFPNQFSIYLHDTPSKRLFSRDARAFSHGCVRVENPFELAYILLAPQYADPKGSFQSLLDSGRERWVNLKEPVKVNLTYRTAWVDEHGQAQFRADVYDRDEAVWAALEEKGLAPAY
ncbi:L,D-transpeptidase family protein [Albimonas sp. CAU 1670]|uniref:L,D-transpeptidase family protein n=1 Tax=Albimonas sp. CAU 1670 TaxID=3032599 RepID=UPI0023DCC374|nr:L,D-transpeptidase family protein [Albimonas sp. CAU 1670]MDF2233065.1 L,D-transpeptidase family protein [Albimonas sp. CAU 1670]